MNTLETIEASLNDVVKSLELIAQRADQSPRGRTEVRGYQMLELTDTIKEALDRLDVEIFNTSAPEGITASIETEPTALEQSNIIVAEAEKTGSNPVDQSIEFLNHSIDILLTENDNWLKFRIPRFDEFHHAFVDVALADNVPEAIRLELERSYAEVHFKQGRLTRETIEYIQGEAEYQLSFIEEKLGDDRDPEERKGLHTDKNSWKRLIANCEKVLAVESS